MGKRNRERINIMQSTPRGLRLHIGIFGRRNAGKSSLLNALAQQDVAIVSDIPGTTADPVDKAMEFPPLGPVVFIDTAGLDDDAEVIGARRTERSYKAMDRCDMALIAGRADQWDELEDGLLETFRKRGIPAAAVFTMSDRAPVSAACSRSMEDRKIPWAAVSVKTGEGLAALRALLIRTAPESALSGGVMLGDLTSPFKSVLLITPIDKEAPKGRMILPQVQAIRDALDHDAWCVVVRENAVTAALAALKEPPALAVTDSQVFGTVGALIPKNIPFTSFSILLARLKGDLAVCAAGAAAIDRLHDGSRILIAEACTHHPAEDDIGKVKIPRLLKSKTGKDLKFEWVSGPDFPADLTGYGLVVHCGACTFNRRAVLTRILACREQHVPFTNYGVCLAHVNGILERALAPFPGAAEAYYNAR